jgi:6-phosphogluconolactonase
MTPPKIVTGSREQLAAAFARHFERAAAAAIRARGRCACAVPGGSVATTFFSSLVDAVVAWPLIDVFWVDERAVPPAHEASNYGLAARLWLRHVPLEPAKIHRMSGEAQDLDDAARAYESELTGALGIPPVIDLALLGMGADGHVASLFPGRPEMGEPRGFAIAVRDAPKPPADRLSLSMQTLMAARSICIAAFDADKAAILRAALETPDAGSPRPVDRLIAAHPDVTVMLNGAAGL